MNKIINQCLLKVTQKGQVGIIKFKIYIHLTK